mmetsp:Transcript_8876/g.21699  ORF Transcript_8876/g.21699 Transcript_8876/m.21699 type:complete len:100 (-) Transcript_8876:159-458(-)
MNRIRLNQLFVVVLKLYATVVQLGKNKLDFDISFNLLFLCILPSIQDIQRQPFSAKSQNTISILYSLVFMVLDFAESGCCFTSYTSKIAAVYPVRFLVL